MEQCSQSILTSGLTFFAATASVAAISQMELISSLCHLISRGALISMAVIILILPALLIVFAPVIAHTTRHWPKPGKAEAAAAAPAQPGAFAFHKNEKRGLNG